MRRLVLTLIGPDRAGLVELVADTVAKHEANWLESRMSRLSGQFAGILEVDVPEEQTDALTRSLGELESRGLRITVERSEQSESGSARELISLELVGQDRPGIVREISRSLAELGVNVEELESSCSPAPMSGEMLFSARIRLLLPTTVGQDQLKRQLEKIASDLMVDFNLSD